MDFENLAMVTNKLPIKWSCDDVSKWLNFIGLQQFEGNFRKAGIDGSILEDLDVEDLENELSIKSNIAKKKIMNWVKHGLKDFSNFILANNKENLNLQKKDSMEVEYEKHGAPNNACYPKVQKIKQLIITPEEGTQSSMFCVSEDGGKIGRHSSNNILVIEQSVSRYHAQIQFDRKKQLFSLVDLKSSTGTFLKITEKLTLKKGMIVQLGSYHFRVDVITSNGDMAGDLLLTIVEGMTPNKQIKLSYRASGPNTFKVGRKDTNEIYFEDTHLSSIHAVITYMNGKFTIQDMNSTNGSWLKLTDDSPTLLENNAVFKIGATSIFRCQYSDSKKSVEVEKTDSCVVCYQNDRDALYLPCKHNLVCLRCSKMVKECPVCRERINDIIKIYK